MRLDQYLLAEGLVPSRERARALIMAGQVYLGGQKATKAGAPVPQGAAVELRGEALPYVSRGGLKLDKALRVFPVSCAGKVCMDVGASTGGFTDCMLQNGAARVYAVDVGYGQLAWKLRSDARVVVMERSNVRHLTAEALPEPIEFFSVDVSFISLRHVLPVMAALTSPGAAGVLLVKPQFEAGREKVGKHGVVRSAAVHLEVIKACAGMANANGFSASALSYSPVKGPKGNIEFLLLAEKAEAPLPLPEGEAERVCTQAHEELDDKDDKPEAPERSGG